jgi:hypothetical protein
VLTYWLTLLASRLDSQVAITESRRFFRVTGSSPPPESRSPPCYGRGPLQLHRWSTFDQNRGERNAWESIRSQHSLFSGRSASSRLYCSPVKPSDSYCTVPYRETHSDFATSLSSMARNRSQSTKRVAFADDDDTSEDGVESGTGTSTETRDTETSRSNNGGQSAVRQNVDTRQANASSSRLQDSQTLSERSVSGSCDNVLTKSKEPRQTAGRRRRPCPLSKEGSKSWINYWIGYKSS